MKVSPLSPPQKYLRIFSLFASISDVSQKLIIYSILQKRMRTCRNIIISWDERRDIKIIKKRENIYHLIFLLITWSMMSLVKDAADASTNARPNGLRRLLLASVSDD